MVRVRSVRAVRGRLVVNAETTLGRCKVPVPAQSVKRADSIVGPADRCASFTKMLEINDLLRIPSVLVQSCATKCRWILHF